MKIEYCLFEDLKEITLKQGVDYYIFENNIHLNKLYYGYDGRNSEYLKMLLNLSNVSTGDILQILDTKKITINNAIQYTSEIDFINFDYKDNIVTVKYKVTIAD